MKQMFLLAIDQMINVMADYSLWASGSSCCFLPGISDSRSRGLQIVCYCFNIGMLFLLSGCHVVLIIVIKVVISSGDIVCAS